MALASADHEPFQSRRLPDRLSASALERYRTCPRLFLLADVERVERTTPPSPVLCRANALHGALDRFYTLPVEERDLATLHSTLRQVWPLHRRPGTFTSKMQERDYGLSALEMLSAYAEIYDLAAQPLAREKWVRATIEGKELYGKVDRVDPAPYGGLDLIDYKTGRQQLDPDDLRHDTAALVYLLATEATLGVDVERVRFIYLASGDEIRWTVEREDVAEARARLAALMATIEHDPSFAPHPGPACRYCPVRRRCPAADTILNDPDLPF